MYFYLERKNMEVSYEKKFRNRFYMRFVCATFLFWCFGSNQRKCDKRNDN